MSRWNLLEVQRIILGNAIVGNVVASSWKVKDMNVAAQANSQGSRRACSSGYHASSLDHHNTAKGGSEIW